MNEGAGYSRKKGIGINRRGEDCRAKGVVLGWVGWCIKAVYIDFVGDCKNAFKAWEMQIPPPKKF